MTIKLLSPTQKTFLMNNNNNLSNAAKQQTEAGVMRLLNLTAEQYDAFKVRCGRSFLQNLLHRYPQLIDEILEKQAYWNWWNNHYLLRDGMLLNEENIHCIHPQILAAMYSVVHNPYTLAGNLPLDSVVFDGLSFTQKPAI